MHKRIIISSVLSFIAGGLLTLMVSMSMPVVSIDTRSNIPELETRLAVLKDRIDVLHDLLSRATSFDVRVLNAYFDFREEYITTERELKKLQSK